MTGPADSLPRGTYALTGPMPKAEAGRTPMRGDLAHIGLAGRFFVPHYAVPQPRAVMPGGASVMTGTGEDAPELCSLMEGDSFEVLDVVGVWAWGCLSLDGPTGFVRVDRLEAFLA